MIFSKWVAATAGLFACAVSGSNAQDKFTADKVLAVVGQSVVLYSEVERYSKALVEQSKQQGYTSQRDPRCEALEHLIIQKLLYNQSQIDSLTVPMDRVAERVQQLVDEQILERGSVAALEMYYHKPIFNIREELRETIEEGAYASEMERTIKDKVHVTPGEVEKFVKGMSKDSVPIIPEQYVFAQIVRYPSNADEAKLRAQERLLELRERIINGDKFDMLARTYSEDPQSAIRGGDLGLMTKEMLVPEFAEAMMKLKPGQVSGVVETDYGFHLIQLIEKIGSQYHARHILLKPQYTDMDMEEPYNVLDSVQRQIVDGTITFEEAAMKYSQDKYSESGTAGDHELRRSDGGFGQVLQGLPESGRFPGARKVGDRRRVETLHHAGLQATDALQGCQAQRGYSRSSGQYQGRLRTVGEARSGRQAGERVRPVAEVEGRRYVYPDRRGFQRLRVRAFVLIEIACRKFA